MEIPSRGVIAALAFGLFVLYRIVSHYRWERHYAAEAKRLGCLPPPRLQNRWPLGMDHVRNAIAEVANMRLPQHVAARYASMGNRTHSQYIAGTEGIFTADPRNVQAILATQFKDFKLGSKRAGAFAPLFGAKGIFTVDGGEWEHARALLRPQFAREQISDLDLEEEHVQNLMRALPVDGATGWTADVDLQPLFFRLTIDAACEFLFGQSVDSQLLALPENAGQTSLEGKQSHQHILGRNPVRESEFAGAFDRAQLFIAMQSRFMDYYWVYQSRQAYRDNKTVHRFIDYFVHEALQRIPPGADDPEKFAPVSPRMKGKYVFLDAMVASTRDPIELRSQLLNILLAGRDTTAGLLGYTFNLLARHPEVFGKLRRAVLDDFGPYEPSSPHADGNITFGRLKACSYLQHVLNESLRLNPLVPLNSRRSTRATTLPRGGGPDGNSPIYIRPEQQVDYSVYVMQRLPELWGPDADEFKPERWVGRKPGWDHVPFNGGPRICLGQQLALTEAGYVIVRLLQRFDRIENLDTSPELLHNLTLTSCPANGARVRMHEAAPMKA